MTICSGERVEEDSDDLGRSVQKLPGKGRVRLARQGADAQVCAQRELAGWRQRRTVDLIKPRHFNFQEPKTSENLLRLEFPFLMKRSCPSFSSNKVQFNFY